VTLTPSSTCRKRGVNFVLHAGDFCSPFSLRPFVEMNMPLIGVFGRNDGDREGLRAFAQQGVGIELFESPHSASKLGGAHGS
jgi:predicted phosphodiesterase